MYEMEPCLWMHDLDLVAGLVNGMCTGLLYVHWSMVCALVYGMCTGSSGSLAKGLAHMLRHIWTFGRPVLSTCDCPAVRLGCHVMRAMIREYNPC